MRAFHARPPSFPLTKSSGAVILYRCGVNVLTVAGHQIRPWRGRRTFILTNFATTTCTPLSIIYNPRARNKSDVLSYYVSTSRRLDIHSCLYRATFSLVQHTETCYQYGDTHSGTYMYGDVVSRLTRRIQCGPNRNEDDPSGAPWLKANLISGLRFLLS